MPPSLPWSDLPIEVLGLFLDLLCFGDHVRFGAVCKSWRAAALAQRHHRAIRLPWLVLVPQDPVSLALGFFSPSEGRSYQIRLDSPVAPRGRCLGSSEGWLSVTHDTTGHNHLLNPIKGLRITIPRTSMLPFRIYPPYIEQTVLASPPRLNTRGEWVCLAVAIHSQRSGLAFCKPAYPAWMAFPEVLTDEDDHICDVLFRQGMLYCLLSSEEVAVFEFLPQPSAIATHRPARAPHTNADYNRRPHDQTSSYLVESAGELLMIVRYWKFIENRVGPGNRPHVETVWFNAFKLDRAGIKWLLTESLGEETVFLATGGSISLNATNNDGIRKNCIYFTNDVCLQDIEHEYNDRIVSDMGIFRFEDGSIQPLYQENSQSFRSPALWFMLDI